MHWFACTQATKTYLLQMRDHLDKIVNTYCAVAATAHGEPNFVSFLHKHKAIVVHSADVFLNTKFGFTNCETDFSV